MNENLSAKNSITSEKLVQETQKLLETRGTKALETARNIMLVELKKLECEEVKEAIKYFMNEYWHDVTRPALLSITCEAVGGNPEATTSVAVPFILISGAIDIHDDVIDRSKLKHGKPTVYGKFGEDIALLVGNALLFKGLLLLHEIRKLSERKGAIILETVKNMFFELGDAQAMELKLRKRFDIQLNEYLAVVTKKAADVEAHTRTGAILGNGTQSEVDSLSKYGRKLGKLVILGDDIIDLANPEELLHRIKKEHLPLPAIFALQDSRTNPELAAILGKKVLTKNDARRIFEITYNCPAFDKVEGLMVTLIQKGVRDLKAIKNCRSELESLIRTTYVEFED